MTLFICEDVVADLTVPVLKQKMANSTEEELRALRSSLQQYRSDTNVDLQKNVFKK